MSVNDVNIDWDSFEQNWNNQELTQFLGSLAYTPKYIQIGQTNKTKRTNETFKVYILITIVK